MALAVDCPILDTGQTKCYDNEWEITCPQSGKDFYGQDAQHICNPQSYTMLSGGIMVQDNVTGLIWEVKQNLDTIQDYNNPHDADNTYTWYDGSSGTPSNDKDTLDFITALNDAYFGGFNDWRLPTIKEISTIVDSNILPGPTINTDYFPNTVSSDYWSSTTRAYYPLRAWFVNFYYGGVIHNWKSRGYYVRAVRAGQCGSFDNFIDNGDGTVTNIDTGLMWQQDTAPGKYTWQEAVSYCETLTLASHNDWRLPNVKELQSLVNYNEGNPSINLSFFPNTQSFWYWSSTTYALDPYGAWLVGFYDGDVYNYNKSGNYYYVQAVRAGQCGSFDTSTTTSVASTTTTISGSTTTSTSISTTTSIYNPPPPPKTTTTTIIKVTSSSTSSTTTSTSIKPTTTTTILVPVPTSTSSISSTTTTIMPICLIEQIYGEDSEETELLRYLRDNVLSTAPKGQELIRLYYEWSPVIVEMMEEDEEFKAQVKEMIDGVLELIGE
jgi:hypothetical protein